MHDNEFTQTYALRNCTAELHLDPAEVAQVAYWQPQAVLQALRQKPEQFTCWFRAELHALDVTAL